MFNIQLIGAGLGILLSVSFAAGGDPIISEDFKFSPDDGAGFDFFGAVAAIHNGVVAMGLPNDDNIVAENSGSVYLFDATTGLQLYKLNPSMPSFGARFGISVAIDNDLVAIGTQEGDNGLNSGSAYLFDSTTGLQVLKLLPDDGQSENHFGSSIDLQGAVVAIGANRDNDNGTNSGSAYLFDAKTGMQTMKLLPDDGETGDQFGISIAIESGIVVVGASFDDENGADAGAVYLFDSSTGDQLFKLLADDGAAGDGFGESVAIDNGIVAIGARFDGDNGAISGSAYLFDAATGLQLLKILPDDGAANDQFGNKLSIHNGILAIGAHQENANGSLSGSAYLFNVDSGEQIAKLVSSDGSSTDFFGESIAINKGIIVVGAIGDDDNGSSSGSGYIFTAPVTTDCTADFTNDGVLNFFDVSAFLQAFNAQDPIADLTNDGRWNFFDVSAFLQAFSEGCP